MNSAVNARSLLSGLVCLLALLGGCATRGAPPRSPAPGTRVVVEPAPAAEAPLPALPISRLDESAGPLRVVERLEVVDQDLRLVVRSLAEQFGLDYEIHPLVSGRVTTRLRDVPLEQALDAVVLPHGYGYQIQGSVLRIVPARMESRLFNLDYISLSRAGFSTTVVQRRLGAVGTAAQGSNTFGGGVGGLLGGGGADIIQSVAVADLWTEIRVGLEGVIFEEATTAGATTGANQLDNQLGLAGGAPPPGAFSRVAEDGRRLIINPLSGTILVAAPPERLAEVAAFLSTVEASVQRQVLIEAKIVEVVLRRDFEYGIDWNLVGRVGSVDLRLTNQPGEFRLGSPRAGDEDEQISVVLEALESQGDVRVLSSPRVSGLNNQRAVINVATDQVFFAVTREPILNPTGGVIGFTTQVQPQQIAVGIVLDVFPQIGPDNTITMNVRPVVTDVVETKELVLEDGTQVSAPVIDRRETDTVVRVRSGETVVIGGLMQTRQDRSRSGLPGLGRIPVLGPLLFGGYRDREEKRELVIFLTPTIIAGQPPIGS